MQQCTFGINPLKCLYANLNSILYYVCETMAGEYDYELTDANPSFMTMMKLENTESEWKIYNRQFTSDNPHNEHFIVCVDIEHIFMGEFF